MRDKVHEIVDHAIDEVNELLPPGQQMPKDPDTVLLGQGGKLDSMGFVNLLVALEAELETQLGLKAVLADEAMNNGEELRTVGDLHELLMEIIQGTKSQP
jgi:acyl carrier protein